jgi:hypothetical protein
MAISRCRTSGRSWRMAVGIERDREWSANRRSNDGRPHESMNDGAARAAGPHAQREESIVNTSPADVAVRIRSM